jgi:hypothetical protein
MGCVPFWCPKRKFVLHCSAIVFQYYCLDLIEFSKGKLDFDHWIQEPAILGKVLQACMYNSMPMDMIEVRYLDTE